MHHPYFDGKQFNKPYPYFQNPNYKNLTMQRPQTIINPPHPFPKPKIDSEFSDDMKRQLRDGKVILLSDSVVRSNFEQDSEKDKEKNEKDVVIQQNRLDGKNETQTHN
ncbi:uncharacterized protein CEXT_180421 [Caerostris extrusa]|uniref:Uncharacterized protein n=1 Tax=Caerostris extrusa TaxID=172846 RepID=A0AAV4NTY5_CAEEX|nr:uncharacterized protein CEXT_180421 [Caerostris extrusa]